MPTPRKKAQSLPKTIGSNELVAFPDYELTEVPAKTDTGADSSAVWASNIHLEDDKLVFNFFAPGSVWYNEEPVVCTVYRSTVVKNSFGVKEFRYKIRLRIKLGDTVRKRWFSLADRSNNTYPVLLGRNFLKDKFVVDVSSQYIHGGIKDVHKIAIFTRDIPESVAFFEKVSSQAKGSISYDCMNYDSLLFYINGAATKVQTVESGTDIASYDYTYFKNHHDRELACAAATYLQFKGRSFADQEFATFMSGSKLSEYMKLACYGIPVPPTLCAKTSVLLDRFEFIEETLGLPFVLKATGSDKGKDNYLISERADFVKILKDDKEQYVWCAQKYIPNDGFYRFCALHKEVSLAVWRAAVPHENRLKQHLNKPRGSANASKVSLDSLPGDAEHLALKAASCMNRQVAGVDLIQDKASEKWYILEVNNDPQIRSGSFPDEKVKMMADFFEKELKR